MLLFRQGLFSLVEESLASRFELCVVLWRHSGCNWCFDTAV